MKTAEQDFSAEFQFKTSRSSGKGGQHVNKTESRVSLFFNIEHSLLLSKQEKELITNVRGATISKENVLQIDVEDSRSQKQNKKISIEKFYDLLRQALKPKKKRKASKPTKAAIRKRLKEKKMRAEVKKNRRLDL